MANKKVGLVKHPQLININHSILLLFAIHILVRCCVFLTLRISLLALRKLITEVLEPCLPNLGWPSVVDIGCKCHTAWQTVRNKQSTKLKIFGTIMSKLKIMDMQIIINTIISFLGMEVFPNCLYFKNKRGKEIIPNIQSNITVNIIGNSTVNIIVIIRAIITVIIVLNIINYNQ